MDYDKNKFIEDDGKLFLKYSYLVRNRGECINYLDRKKFRTENFTIRYYIDYKNKNEYIDIPPCYVFDFNSAPCFGHCVVDTDEFMIALIHDRLFDKDGKIIIKDLENLSPTFKKLEKYGYGTSTHFLKDKQYTEFLYTRKFADKIWLYGAIEESKQIERVDKSKKAYLGYLAIRIGGAKNFRK